MCVCQSYIQMFKGTDFASLKNEKNWHFYEPAACGSCWLSAKDQEAVTTAPVCEQEKQVKAQSVGCHPAVSLWEKVTDPAWHLGGNAYDKNHWSG